MKTKLFKNGVIFLLAIALFSSNIFAFAVSSQYSKTSPLEMYTGETKTITVDLQNMPGPDDILAQGSITEGSEIARLLETEYEIPVGSRIPIEIRIEIPKETTQTEYLVKISFNPTSGTENGSFGFGSAVEKEILVKIIQKPEEVGRSYTLVYLIIALIVLVLIILAVVKRKSRVKKSK